METRTNRSNLRLKIFLFFTVTLFSLLTTSAQTCSDIWNYTTKSGANTTKGYDIAKDMDGSVYVCGTFDNAAIFPHASCNINLMGVGPAPSAFIAKFNPCGQLVWINYETEQGRSEGRTLTVDTLGHNVFMAGSAEGNIQFLATAATSCAKTVKGSVSSATCYYIAAFNKNTGAHLATHVPAATAPYTNYEINSIAFKKNSIQGNIIYDLFLCGSAFETSSSKRNALISNSSLSTASYIYTTNWARFSSSNGILSQASDLVYNPTFNNISITGDFINNLNFSTGVGNTQVTTLGAKDGFICSFDATNGNAQPASFLNTGVNSGESAAGTAITLDHAGDVYYTGWYTGNISLLYGYSPLAGNSLIKKSYAMRLSGTSLVWKNNINTLSGGQNEVTGIAVNSSKVFLCGMFWDGNMSFGNAPGNYVSSTPGLKRVYIASLDRNTGNFFSGNVTQSTILGSNHISTKITAKNNYVYSTGNYINEINYTSGTPPSGALNSSSNTNYDLFVLRNATGVNNPFRLMSLDPSDEKASANNNISIYPNPANTSLTLDIKNGVAGKEIKIEIFEMDGKLVYSNSLQYENNLAINLNFLERGIYFIKINGENIDHKEKLIKE